MFSVLHRYTIQVLLHDWCEKSTVDDYRNGFMRYIKYMMNQAFKRKHQKLKGYLSLLNSFSNDEYLL